MTIAPSAERLGAGWRPSGCAKQERDPEPSFGKHSQEAEHNVSQALVTCRGGASRALFDASRGPEHPHRQSVLGEQNSSNQRGDGPAADPELDHPHADLPPPGGPPFGALW